MYARVSLAPDPERVRDRRRHHDDGQPDQPDGEAVDADVVRDVQVAEPGAPLRELQPAAVEVEAGDHLDPDADLGERGEQCERARRDALSGSSQTRSAAAEREEDEEVVRSSR